MLNNEKNLLRIAVLDLYEGMENEGIHCIRTIAQQFGESNNLEVVVDEFEVRIKKETPDLSYDIYISSGGPGSPLDSEGSEWEAVYFNWLKQIEDWNNSIFNHKKKYIFLICHSFQLLCRHYNIGNVCKRKSTSFGIYPVHLLDEGKKEPVFEILQDPFYAVDSRDYQVIEPNDAALKKTGATILAIEKERPHVALPRAIMAVRFNDYMIGFQFHPEADAVGMSKYLQMEEKKKAVIKTYGTEKWESIVEQLSDPNKIMFTYAHLLPKFLQLAMDDK